MRDLLPVQIFQGWKQLLHDVRSEIFGEMLVLNDVLEELATLTVPISIKNNNKHNFDNLTYSRTKKQTSFHSQISYNLIIFGWSYSDANLINIWLSTYERLQDFNLVDKRVEIFNLFLLDSLDSEFLLGLPVFCFVNDAESSRCELFYEVIFVFDSSVEWLGE